MTRTRLALLLLGLLAGVYAGCKEEGPPVVWDEGASGADTPAITSADPPSALGLISRVTLTGRNFSPVDTANMVYFGTTRATVVSASPTSLVVIPPDLDQGGYTIKVAVPGAFQVATFGPYTVEHAGVEYGNFQDLDEVYAVAIDAQENLYAHLKLTIASRPDTGLVFKVSPLGVKTLFGATTFASARDMKIGPGGSLYLQQVNSRNLYRIPPGGGSNERFATLPGNASFLDFDSSGNIFVGGNGGLFVVDRAGAARAVGAYQNQTIRAVRVFAGAIYVAVATPAAGIYRNRILNAQGDLEAGVRVLDWAQSGGTYPPSGIWSLAIAADGTLYIGTDNVNPVLAVPPGGAPAPLYPGVLTAPARQLAWGSGQYLYCNRWVPASPPPRRVIRIVMGKNGAPDFGRQ